MLIKVNILLITPAELHQVLHAPCERSNVPLEPLASAQEAADALSEVFHSLEEALDDFTDPAGDDAKDERRRLRALHGAIDLFRLLAQQRGA
jgi:hypothetical protein